MSASNSSSAVSGSGQGDGKLLVRRPSPHLASGQITHITAPTTSFISHPPSLSQRTSYTSVFARCGWEIHTVLPADHCPDSVFVEDAVVFFGSVALITSPGTSSREDEIVGVEEFLETNREKLGLTETKKIVKPGMLDGGDILKVGKTVYVGQISRTNDEGRRQLKEVVEKLGWEVKNVPVTKALHLKSAVTALPDGTMKVHRTQVSGTTVAQAVQGL